MSLLILNVITVAPVKQWSSSFKKDDDLLFTYFIYFNFFYLSITKDSFLIDHGAVLVYCTLKIGMASGSYLMLIHTFKKRIHISIV